MTTVEDRLNEQLNQKEQEIAKLNQQIEDLQCKLRGIKSGWMAHETLDKEQTLPVPRLEIVWFPMGGDDREWSSRHALYRLVYESFWGDVIGVPLGSTSVNGGCRGERPVYRETENTFRIEMPFRDGAHICHDMEKLKLRGFLICEELVQEITGLDAKDRW